MKSKGRRNEYDNVLVLKQTHGPRGDSIGK